MIKVRRKIKASVHCPKEMSSEEQYHIRGGGV